MVRNVICCPQRCVQLHGPILSQKSDNLSSIWYRRPARNSSKPHLTRVLVQASFQCLRLSNFLVRPSLESLQALLILGFVLANDMKAEASWSLLGMTARLATSLGLHRGSHENMRIPLTANDLPRRKLWYLIVPHVRNFLN